MQTHTKQEYVALRDRHAQNSSCQPRFAEEWSGFVLDPCSARCTRSVSVTMRKLIARTGAIARGTRLCPDHLANTERPHENPLNEHRNVVHPERWDIFQEGEECESWFAEMLWAQVLVPLLVEPKRRENEVIHHLSCVKWLLSSPHQSSSLRHLIPP